MEFTSRDGQVISEEEWRKLRQDESYYVLAEDWVDDIFISTVWWGLDFGLGNFDTWICGGKLNDSHFSYGDQIEALEGHRKMVDLVREDSIGEAPDEPAPSPLADILPRLGLAEPGLA